MERRESFEKLTQSSLRSHVSRKAEFLSEATGNRPMIIARLAAVGFLFLLSASGLIFFFINLPGMSINEQQQLRQLLPVSFIEATRLWNLSTIRTIFAILVEYKKRHPLAVGFLLSGWYLLYQSFPILTFPFAGCASGITILFGALYHPGIAFSLVSLLTAVGPSMAFLIFRMLGKPLVISIFPSQFNKLREKFKPFSAKTYDSSTGNVQFDIDLFLTLLCLRISPFPNLIINVAAPVLDVPFNAFFFATWLGLIPNTLVLVSLGTTLSSLESMNEGWRPFLMFIFSVVCVYVLKKFVKKYR